MRHRVWARLVCYFLLVNLSSHDVKNTHTAAAININNKAFLEEDAQAFIHVDTKCPGDALCLLFTLKRERIFQELSNTTTPRFL